MRFLSSAIDRLPGWAKAIVYGFVLVAAVYGVLDSIAHHRLGSFLLHAIFSPQPHTDPFATLSRTKKCVLHEPSRLF